MILNKPWLKRTWIKNSTITDRWKWALNLFDSFPVRKRINKSPSSSKRYQTQINEMLELFLYSTIVTLKAPLLMVNRNQGAINSQNKKNKLHVEPGEK